MKTKSMYAEQVGGLLINNYPNIDWKIDERDIFVRMDSIVNEMARKSMLDNWKLSMSGIDEQFITTWPILTVTDQLYEMPSYFDLPVNYADLPMGRGIDEIWPLKLQAENHSVVILTHHDVRLYSNNMAGAMAGRLAGYPEGYRFYFTSCDVKKKYGDVGLRLVIRDASLILSTVPYPIPSDKEEEMITRVVKWFVDKRTRPTDVVRDKNDRP